jgi:hypothetical protein
MKKNLGVPLFVFFWAVSLAFPTAIPKIEHLAWVSTLLDEPLPYEGTFDPTDVSTNFQSGTILTFAVPGSKAGSELFFEVNGSLSHVWSGDVPRRMSGNVWLEIISPLIPAGVYVKGGLTVASYSSNNASEAGQTGGMRSSRYIKLILRAGHLDWWSVGYTSTGDLYPDAIPLLTQLIKNGFTVNVYVDGTVRGVTSVTYVDISVHATRTTG